MAGLVKGYDEEFVTQLYHVILNREPDRAGLEHYLNALGAGLPPHEIVATLLHSKEFSDRAAPRSSMTDGPDAPDQTLTRLETLSHGGRAVYVGNNRILTKVSLGPWNFGFLLEADDLLLAPHLFVDGYHEIDLTNFFIRNVQPGNNCLDVGANFGYFTCVMARWSTTGKVIGLEPDGMVYDLLRDNIYINSLEGIAVARNTAAADKDTRLTFYRRVTRSGNTSIAKIPESALAEMGEPASVRFDVLGIPIDALLPEFNGRVDFIKIDVEGAEPLVFRGARETIATNPQLALVMEWAPAQIRQAGFDVGEFVAELPKSGLGANIIKSTDTVPISWETLSSLDYSPGILLNHGV